jgi:hypothetical protein
MAVGLRHRPPEPGAWQLRACYRSVTVIGRTTRRQSAGPTGERALTAWPVTCLIWRLLMGLAWFVAGAADGPWFSQLTDRSAGCQR